MRISSLNNINFAANATNKPSEKNIQKDNNVVLQKVSKTPDYQVKTPQKYTKIETVNLPENLNAHVYKLESGQRVVIVPKEGPTIIKTYVNTGSLNEDDSVRGISHFVEHSLFNGSDGLKEGEFFETVNKMGANTNASTGFSATDYYIKSNLLNNTDLEKQIKIHSSMLETPKFTSEMITKEKGPVTSEISMILDDSANVAVNTTIKNLFGIKSTSEDIIGGTIENINNLTREKVLDYYKQNYYPSNMVTVITGDVKEKETMALVSKYMQSKVATPKTRKFEKLVPIQNTVRKDVISDKIPVSVVSVGLAGPENNNIKDKVIFDAVKYLLTDSTYSRLNKSLEKIQTEASVMIERLTSKPTDNNAILIGLEVDDKNSEKALKYINEALLSIINNPPKNEEIKVITKNLKFDFANHFDKSSTVNDIVGSSMLDGDLSIVCDYEKILDNLTSQDFVDFAKKYLDTNKQAITIVHPAKNNKISFSGRQPLNTENIKTETLSNNALLLKNSINKNIVYVDLKISSDNSDYKYGAAKLLSGLLERGTADKTKDEFYEQAEKDGIMLGFSSSGKSISASSVFMKSDTEKALKNLKSVILNPRFNSDDFEEVKKQLIQNLESIPKNAQDGLYSELFKGLPKGISVSEMLESVKNTDLEEVKSLYNDIINNSQMRIAVSGDFKDNKFNDIVQTEFSKDYPMFKETNVKDKKSFTPIEKSKVILNNHNKSQAEIMVGYKFEIKDNTPEQKTKYSLLNIILGGTASSRLFNDLRESQKLAYHVKSFMDYNDDDTGLCNLYIKTTTDNKNNYKNIEKSLNGFEKHIQKLINEKVTEEELENAKLVFKNRLLNDNETTSNKNASIISNSQTKTGVELSNYVMNLIDDITVDDIQKTAREIFSVNPVYSIVAKKEAIENNTKFLNDLI